MKQTYQQAGSLLETWWKSWFLATFTRQGHTHCSLRFTNIFGNVFSVLHLQIMLFWALVINCLLYFEQFKNFNHLLLIFIYRHDEYQTPHKSSKTILRSCIHFLNLFFKFLVLFVRQIMMKLAYKNIVKNVFVCLNSQNCDIFYS